MHGRILSTLAAAVAISASTLLAQPASTQPADPLGTTPLASPATQRSTWTMDPDGTWRQTARAASDVTPGQAAQPDDPAILRARQLLERGNYDAARATLLRFLKAEPLSPQRDLALLLTARAFNGDGNGIKAFYYCDELMDTFPDSPLFVDALQYQFDIAESYLQGRTDRFLLLFPIDRREQGIEMLYRIQQRAPGSPLTEEALLMTADFYWADGQFDLAADAYGFHAQRYPRSPLHPQVRLRQAYSNLAQYNGPLYDPTSVINARAQLGAILAEFPELAEREDVRGKIELSDRQIARKLYLTADFYKRTGKPEAAVHVARRLVSQYPELPETEDAKRLLASLEGS